MPLYTCQPPSFRGRGMCICCTRQSRILLPYISSSCCWYLFWARPLVSTFLWGFPRPHSLAQVQPDHHPQSRSEETLWMRSRRRGKKRAEEGGGSLSSSSRIDCTWTCKTRLSQRNKVQRSTCTPRYLDRQLWLWKALDCITFNALCGYPLVKMELEIQTRFLPRLPFFQDTIISDNTFGMNIWFSFTFNIFSGQDDYSTSSIQILTLIHHSPW